MDIHGGSVPVHLERIAPHRTNFQPIHLGGSFIEAPLKRHAIHHFNPLGLMCLTLLSLSIQDPRPAFPRELHSPVLLFVVFAFVREARFPLPTIVFMFYGPTHRLENKTG
ncbi:hypothetical protein AVEN_25443-1 [Araneus ventricosus]|uniref:Uncharacterized protein n=1 Tax=Araneus ventricosus TaxID=182803 RepID=A0A4Y2TTS8_ARAVE|nr:hypothetical protein AVEN_25443-1 [Araneus ventricosus]